MSENAIEVNASKELCDEEGPIPKFPPRAVDEHGRLIPLSPEERQARSRAAVRALKAIQEITDTDPPGAVEAFMRGIDENRPPGQKLFEGMYSTLARIVFLDSGPLGLAAMPSGKSAVDSCQAWLASLEASGVELVIPAIADFEVRRELVRLGATAKLRKLNDLRLRFDYFPVAEAAWDRAAELWAMLRNAGIPTAGPKDLDADAILAGQALTAGQPGDVVTIATTNVRHLGRFPGVDARTWETIS